MIIEKNIMKTEAKFSDDKTNRFVLSKDWNNKNTIDYMIEFNNENPHLKKYIEFHKLNNSLSLKQNKEKHLKI